MCCASLSLSGILRGGVCMSIKKPFNIQNTDESWLHRLQTDSVESACLMSRLKLHTTHAVLRGYMGSVVSGNVGLGKISQIQWLDNARAL